MTASAAPHWETGRPGFDRERLPADRLPRILELTSTLCTVNAELRDRSSAPDPHGTRPITRELEALREQLLDELHRLTANGDGGS
jgi:hypothetical protein